MSDLEALKAKVDWMEQILKANGVEGPWLTPPRAAPILGVSRDKILAEIKNAEYRRANRKPSDLTYGTHYRNVADPGAEVPAWQVHITEFAEFLKIPPEERK